MYVQVRSVDGKRNATISLSKFSIVKELKELIEKELSVPVEKQRLFYSGKQVNFNFNISFFIILFRC